MAGQNRWKIAGTTRQICSRATGRLCSGALVQCGSSSKPLLDEAKMGVPWLRPKKSHSLGEMSYISPWPRIGVSINGATPSYHP